MAESDSATFPASRHILFVWLRCLPLSCQLYMWDIILINPFILNIVGKGANFWRLWYNGARLAHRLHFTRLLFFCYEAKSIFKLNQIIVLRYMKVLTKFATIWAYCIELLTLHLSLQAMTWHHYPIKNIDSPWIKNVHVGKMMESSSTYCEPFWRPKVLPVLAIGSLKFGKSLKLDLATSSGIIVSCNSSF
jgi:hypothetical protein